MMSVRLICKFAHLSCKKCHRSWIIPRKYSCLNTKKIHSKYIALNAAICHKQNVMTSHGHFSSHPILRSEALTMFKDRCQQSVLFNMTNDNWKTLEQDPLPSNRHSKNVIETTIMQLIHLSRNMDLADSFINYIESKPQSPLLSTLSIYVAMSGTCSGKDGQDKLYAAYDKMLRITPVFDFHTTRKLILGLSHTDRWRECFELMEMAKLSGTLWKTDYSAVVNAALVHDDIQLAKSIFEEMNQNEIAPKENVFETMIKLSANPESIVDIHLLFECLQKYSWTIENTTALLLKDLFLGNNKEKFSAVFTIVNKKGICQSCHQSLDYRSLSPGDFKKLRQEFYTKVLLGEDVYIQSDPEEINIFQMFLHKYGPFNVVIDALNIEGKQFGRPSLLRLVDHFADKGQKVLVIGRKRRFMKGKPIIASKARIFDVEKVSKDDLFSLYAAIHSGDDCVLLSHDQMRDHKHQLGVHKYLFDIWQKTHQVTQCYSNAQGNIQLKAYDRYDTMQTDADGWHIPYTDENKPNSWLCLRRRNEETDCMQQCNNAINELLTI